jgi:hypothetical protein
MLTGLSVFSYYYICVPHTNIYVSWNTGIDVSSCQVLSGSSILDVT